MATSMGEEQNLEPEGGEPLSDTTSVSEAAPKGPLTPGQRLAAKKAAKAVKKKEFKDEIKRQETEAQQKAEQEMMARATPARAEPALPEEVQVVARGFSDFVHEQRGRILGGITAFLVISAAVILGQRLMAAGDSEAAAAFAGALKIVSAGIDAADTDGKNDNGEPVFATREARTKKVIESFASVAAKHGDKPVGNWAKLEEAAAHMELGAYDKALALFESGLAAGADQPALKRRALEGAGLALEAAGKDGEAKKRFEELKGLGEGEARDLGEYHLARLALKAQDRETGKALLKGLYDRLSDRPEGTPPSRFLRAEVENRLAQIDSSLVDKGTVGGGGESFSQEQLEQLLQQLKSQGGGVPGAE